MPMSFLIVQYLCAQLIQLLKNPQSLSLILWFYSEFKPFNIHDGLVVLWFFLLPNLLVFFTSFCSTVILHSLPLQDPEAADVQDRLVYCYPIRLALPSPAQPRVELHFENDIACLRYKGEIVKVNRGYFAKLVRNMLQQRYYVYYKYQYMLAQWGVIDWAPECNDYII